MDQQAREVYGYRVTRHHASPLSTHEYVQFYNKDYKTVIEIFERNFPDLQKEMPKAALHLFTLRRFQNYIYALSEAGQQKKADALWNVYGHIVLNKPENKSEFFYETIRRDQLRIRHTIMSGQHDLALQQLAQAFDNNNFWYWNYIELDPIYDAVREYPKYIEIMDGVKEMVAKQRGNVRAYLVGLNYLAAVGSGSSN